MVILNQLFGTTIRFWRSQPSTERADDTILIGTWPGTPTAPYIELFATNE
jgi:hypothetical protein